MLWQHRHQGLVMLKNRNPNVTIVGATGAVGETLLTLIEERNFPFARLELVASKRSEGKRIKFKGHEFTVKNLETFDFSSTDLAFFSAGTQISRQWAKKAAEQGALVIDNTNAFRMDPLCPLVVPQVNAFELRQRPVSGIIGNPNCSTIQMVRILKPIHERYGLEKIVVSTYQAASGAGLTGMQELRDDTQANLHGELRDSKRFPKPIAFNVIPQIDVFMDTGFTLEEQKMVQETRKIFGLPNLFVTATAVRVPVLNNHSEAVYIETKKAVDVQQIIKDLKNTEEVIVYEGNDYPTPRLVQSKNSVHVGRIRVNPDNQGALWCWIVADNLRIGAALNAIQIAEKIL